MMKRSLQSSDEATLVVAGTGLVAVTYGVLRYGFGLQLPRIRVELGLTSTVAGVVAAGSFAAYCLAALGARTLVGRGRARLVLWSSAGLAATGALVVAVAWSAPVLAAGVLVAGSAAGAASPALVVAVAASVRGSRLPRSQAVVNSGTGVGVALTGVATVLAPGAWRPVWVVAAALALLAAARVDRGTHWSAPAVAADPGTGPETVGGLAGPVLAAAVAGLGSAAVWTFGRDLLTATGGLGEGTTAVLWVALGASAVLGGLSGDAVRVLGLRLAWQATTVVTALGTALLVLAPASVPVATAGAVLFGGAYTAMSGVLVAWAGRVRPARAGGATATLFVALTAGQAVGSVATGALADVAGLGATFWAGAAVVALAAAARPPAEVPARRVWRGRSARPAGEGGAGLPARRVRAGRECPVGGWGMRLRRGRGGPGSRPG